MFLVHNLLHQDEKGLQLPLTSHHFLPLAHGSYMKWSPHPHLHLPKSLLSSQWTSPHFYFGELPLPGSQFLRLGAWSSCSRGSHMAQACPMRVVHSAWVGDWVGVGRCSKWGHSEASVTDWGLWLEQLGNRHFHSSWVVNLGIGAVLPKNEDFTEGSSPGGSQDLFRALARVSQQSSKGLWVTGLPK